MDVGSFGGSCASISFNTVDVWCDLMHGNVHFRNSDP